MKSGLIAVLFLAAVGAFIWLSPARESGNNALIGDLASAGTTIIGTISAVSPREIVLRNFAVLSNGTSTIATSETGSITVLLDSSTVIQRVTQKDMAVFKEEQSAYLAQVENLQDSTATVPTPPSPVVFKKLLPNELKVGEVVTVRADHDISRSTSFTAVKIELFDLPNNKTSL